MKKMFRTKDRRKLMRTRSQESTTSSGAGTGAGTDADQPVPPIPMDSSFRSSASGGGSAPPPLTRRSTLHRTTASLASYRATPITKHYAVNNQILTAFESHYAQKLFHVAYAIGLQFVETALLEIPKHGYFYSTRHTDERITNGLDAIRVSSMLRTILEQEQENPSLQFGMDLQQEYTKVQKLSGLAVAQSESSTFDDYDQPRFRMEAELNELKKKGSPSTLLGDACGPLFDSFTETMCPPGGGGMIGSILPTSLLPTTYNASSATASTAGPEMSRDSISRAYAIPPALELQKEPTVSSVMRHIMHHPSQQSDRNRDSGADPPALRSMNSGASVPPPPPLLDNGTDGDWNIMPEVMPDRPEFGRQMSGRTYADHVALERALYLSGLEVQPDILENSVSGHGDHGLLMNTNDMGMAIPEDNLEDEHWMLEHALKESEREMERLKMQEAQQIFEACQQSEKQQLAQQDQALQQFDGFQMPAAPQLQRRLTKSRLEIETLHMLYHEDFLHLWNTGRVRVTHVHTYQGKNPGSTNGCTVIAPLLCIHHFMNYAEPTSNGGGADDPGLPDETIKTVIDDEVPSILPRVREELGVAKDAFLIPSDSHDYLVQNQLLSQDQFVTVIGGNILDEGHLNGLVRTLIDGFPPPEIVQPEEEGEAKADDGDDADVEETETKAKDDPPMDSSNKSSSSNRDGDGDDDEPPPKPPPSPPAKKRVIRPNAKIACTVFFHEHVVSILKLRRSHGGKAWYDIIDSLPSKAMLSREVGAARDDDDDEDDNVPLDPASVMNGKTPSEEFGFSLKDLEPPLNTARIRCLDEEALSAALKWYACARFSSENLNYIDAYPWNDNSTDFDPRVFQAFVWTEAE